MGIEKLLTKLKKDRRVDKSWIKKLSEAGLEIGFGRYGYWDNQPYAKIGESTIFLVETFYNCYGSSVQYIRRKEAIERIRTEAMRQLELSDDLDEKERLFFEKLKGE